MSSEPTNVDYIFKVMSLLESDDLQWKVDTTKKTVEFFVPCNDLFFWGTSDAVDLSPENVHLLEEAVAEVNAIKEMSYTAAALFCAKVIRMRPQGAMYDHIFLEYWPLFDACGPERKTGLGNPRPQDRSKATSLKKEPSNG